MDNLKLADWKVSYELINNDTMIKMMDNHDTYFGMVSYKPNVEEATIYINTEKDYDHRITLIHEFLHIMMIDYIQYIKSRYNVTDLFSNQLEERFINRLTYSIMNIMDNRYINE